ncbi:MAG: YdcH family protein [Myxococcales bacterium]|nr:YdcH family protein [Myxococcales bacterium]MCB9579759.1 YdcH family protein [Polyangiaceae bacterium]
MSEPMADDRLNALEQEHQTLKEAVRRLERRAHLTAPEQREIAELKKQKLATKDQIAAIKR